MKATRATLLLVGVSFLVLAEVSCNLILPEPSLTLTAQPLYLGSQASIQYSINGLSNSGGSYYCTYTLSVKNPFTGIYIQLTPYPQAQGGITHSYPAQGSFTAYLSQYQFPSDVASLNPLGAGDFELVFSVLQNGSSSASSLPFLTRAVYFTLTGSASANSPDIYAASAPIVNNVTAGQPFTLKGANFGATDSLTASTPAILGTTTITPPDTITSAITCTSCAVGSTVTLQVFDPSTGLASPAYNLLVVNSLAGAPLSLTPSSAYAGTTAQPIMISTTTGLSCFGSWTGVSMTDYLGNPIPVKVVSYSMTYLLTYANLSTAQASTVTPGTITLTNPDGTNATGAFTIN